MFVRRLPFALLTAVVAMAALPALTQAQFSQSDEAKNFSKTEERARYEHMLPDYRAELTRRSAEELAETALIKAGDPERDFSGNLCQTHGDGCAGDVRYYDWDKEGFGLRQPILWTARNGSTISGHVWATRAGPAKRPGIVITNGSVQAPEELYWGFAAAVLAKAGYVVFTWDPQGQGRSDTYGEGVDRNEGFPSQTGGPFYDQTEDALDFFFSTPAATYVPRKSCSTGTSHAAKQDRRVAERRNAAFNPYWDLLDTTRVGIAGHSLGAAGVSHVGQKDSRVKAIVAWDNLGTPSGTGIPTCLTAPTSRSASPITKPAIGMSNDYGLTPSTYTSAPPPEGKNGASKAFSTAGVDTAQINTRGGTHYEYSYIPDPAFGATLRGMDMASWYTLAWFDKYVKGDPSADARLLTTRWRADSRGAEIDQDKDGNLYSKYLLSRIDIGLTGGGRAKCENVRAGCPVLSAADGQLPNYSYFIFSRTKDAAPDGTGSGATGGRGPVGPGTARFFAQTVSVKSPRLASDAGRDNRFRVSFARTGRRFAAFKGIDLEYRALPGRTFRRIRSRTTTSSVVINGVYGRTYEVRARARDRTGAAGAWAYSTTTVPFDDFGRLLLRGPAKYDGDWARVAAPAAFGRRLSTSSTAGDTVRFTFTGRRFYVIGRRSASGGRASVLVDGRRAGAISLRSGRVRERVVVANRAVRQGRHTVVLRVLSGRVDLDGYAGVPAAPAPTG